MRQIFTGLVAAIAVGALGVAPAMACGGGGLFTSSSCSPCGSAYVSPCGQSGYGVGYSHHGYSHYQRLAAPSPQYYWVNQGPVYDGPGQFAPRPYYEERSVLGWRGYHRGHYRYTGGPYANPINHYSYGGPAWRGPAITSYRWRRHVRPAHLRYGYRTHSSYRYATRPSVRYGHSHMHNYRHNNVRSGVRYGHRHVGHQAQRMVNPHVVHAPRFRDSGSYSYRSGFRVAPNARHH